MADVSLDGRAVWIQATVELSSEQLQHPQPLALFVSARASSSAYVNGTYVGSNGRPAIRPDREVPGLLDSVFHVPSGTLRPGRNSVKLLASGHSPAIVGSQELHSILIAPFRDSPLMVLPRYLFALLTFGAFVVGALYFGANGLVHRGDRASMALGGASLFAACQLLIEASRGLWAYPYPVHGLRLALIALLTLCVGLTLTIHTAERLRVTTPRWPLLLILLTAAGGVVLLSGFEVKMFWAALVTSLGSAALAAFGMRQRRQASAQYTAVFLILTMLVLFEPVDFFDRHGFWAYTALLGFLFIREAIALRQAERRREEAEGRRRQLEAALLRLSPAGPVTLLVTISGRQHRIATPEVAALSGAGDYVELHLIDRRTMLHSGSLAALEKELPPLFLRVHRSHIVNLDQITELVRLSSGVGELHLRNGLILPVSRRVMPQVRRAFIAGPSITVARPGQRS
ncbi:MAG TPA: LytTR family DNA-binding domain-containing protein [Sphingomonadaceae bacterium]|nr:LytTR family DNA-binding domain-containing protein [Sphingomonadaceae bacterium]